jgi:tetratricopeptide (TPR) repeat protein
MGYDKLDNEELLRLALDAINNGRDADSLVMLKILLERDPQHVYAQYLLAAQHAQLGMFERAEAGFRAAVAAAPDLAIARFQLGQLLVMKGTIEEATQMLAPLADRGDALAAYARALVAAANEDAPTAVRELDQGLALPQEIPALAGDMQRLRDRLSLQGADTAAVQATEAALTEANPISANPMFLASYGREH